MGRARVSLRCSPAMDLRQLATLVAVADHRSFSAAAQVPVHRAVERLGARGQARARAGRHPLRPPPVAAHRSRPGRGGPGAPGARPSWTPSGPTCPSLGADVAGDARLGVIPTTARWLLPPLLDRLRDAAPPGAARGHLGRHDRLAPPPLAGGALDAAVLALPVDDPELARPSLCSRRTSCWPRPSRPPARRRHRVGLAELAGRELLLEAPGTTLRDGLDRAAAAVGVRLTPPRRSTACGSSPLSLPTATGRASCRSRRCRRPPTGVACGARRPSCRPASSASLATVEPAVGPVESPCSTSSSAGRGSVRTDGRGAAPRRAAAAAPPGAARLTCRRCARSASAPEPLVPSPPR